MKPKSIFENHAFSKEGQYEINVVLPAKILSEDADRIFMWKCAIVKWNTGLKLRKETMMGKNLRSHLCRGD